MEICDRIVDKTMHYVSRDSKIKGPCVLQSEVQKDDMVLRSSIRAAGMHLSAHKRLFP